MDNPRWNLYLGGTGTFVVSVVGVLLLTYQIWFQQPNRVAAVPAGSSVTDVIDARSADPPAANRSFADEVWRWLPIGLIVIGTLGGGLLHFAAARGRRSDRTPTVATIDSGQTPIRVLERYYMALARLKEHTECLAWLEEQKGEPSSGSDFIQMGITLDKIRDELMNLSPAIFPTAVAIDFQKSPQRETGYVESKVRVLKEIEELMKKVDRQWGRYAEQAGISPMRFNVTPIVKLDHL